MKKALQVAMFSLLPLLALMPRLTNIIMKP
ncbi:Uncharacterised protein [Escherichia coli]|nr:Uncharacterised protein [Escherichia coli]